MSRSLSSVFKADSIIQREALLSALRAAGIECDSPARDLSRQITASTVDLAYEGFSALKKDTFPILVDSDRQEEALKIINQQLRLAGITEAKPISYLHHFRAACLFSVFVPVFFHLVAIYNLIMHFRSGESEKFWSSRTIIALTLSVVTLPIGLYVLHGIVFE